MEKLLQLCPEEKIHKNEEISKKLDKWHIVCRYDADDNSKHMGLILISSKTSEKVHQLESFGHHAEKRKGKLQIQELIIRVNESLNIGFIYCRSSPLEKEIKQILKRFQKCHILMGDLNLSYKLPTDQRKLHKLCENGRIMLLKEITRNLTNNQLDHILIKDGLEKFCYATSFFNFISDHNSIVVRIGDENNLLTKEALERINFSEDVHLKKIYAPKNHDETSFEEKEEVIIQRSSNSRKEVEKVKNCEKFKRKILNPDASSCWLNACLQLLVTGFEHMKHPLQLNSELGLELLKLKYLEYGSYDPTPVKNIIVLAEDTRIALRKSELENLGLQNDEVERRLENIYLDLKNGQQCVRDFFLCIKENLENWLDVYQPFSLNMVNTIKCIGCGRTNQIERNILNLEIDVPPNGSRLNSYVEEMLNGFIRVGYKCEDGCNMRRGAEKRMMIKSCQETEFIIIILRRVVQEGDESPMIVQHNSESIHSINIRYNMILSFNYLNLLF